MANPVDRGEGVGPDDAVLTAWLDGALTADERASLDRRLVSEPALRARLEFLRRGDRPFGPAFDVLLEAAPTERLTAGLDTLLAQHVGSPRATSSSRPRWRTAAAAAAVFAIGGIAGYFLTSVLNPPPQGWRQTVAEYHALISPDTVAMIRESPTELATELATIGDDMKLDLSPDRTGLPDATLKRAQYYDYNGRSLVQLIYDSASGPFALCIILTDRDDAPISFEQREGSNIVYWYKNGRGYMLIGKDASRDRLEAYAGDLAGRFS